jgi:methionyl-tRNA formyltransferase
MKLVILSTNTVHHAYIVREVAKIFPVENVISEKRRLSPPFDTHHDFEDSIESSERDAWFGGNNTLLGDVSEVTEFDSYNDESTVQFLKEIKTDVILVVGGGLVGKEVIACCPTGIINLHGGDPELYRGLDSHMWAIYHRDFKNMTATLHRLNEKFDDGEIILQQRIVFPKGARIHELRRFNAEACAQMAISGIEMFNRTGTFVSRPQREAGRYYSFMPASIKEICVKRFHKYTEGL